MAVAIARVPGHIYGCEGLSIDGGRGAGVAVDPRGEGSMVPQGVILGTSPGAGAVGRCGRITFTGAIGTRVFP